MRGNSQPAHLMERAFPRGFTVNASVCPGISLLLVAVSGRLLVSPLRQTDNVRRSSDENRAGSTRRGRRGQVVRDSRQQMIELPWNVRKTRQLTDRIEREMEIA